MKNKKGFLYQSVADRIEKMIKDNNLSPADKIPSVREVSKKLKVSISTVMQAYDLLIGKGVIIVKERSGYYVNSFYTNKRETEKETICSMPANVEVNVMSSTMMINARKYAIANFSILAPVPEILPIAKINKKVKEALNDPKNSAFGYPLIEGHPKLIEQITRFSFQWPEPLNSSDILITNGCMEAINLCLEATTKPGDIVVIEKPSYQGLLQSLETYQLKALEVPSYPEEGLDLNLLKESITNNKVAACLLMPRLSNPLGASMSNENKERLVELLSEHDIPLIEDDCLGDVLYSSEPNYPAKAFDKTGNVMYCSSFSKTLSPGFRIGWVSGGKYHQTIKKRKYTTNIATNGVLQDAIALYLETGQYQSHLNRMKLEMQKNLVKYVDSIKKYFPEEIRLSIPKGGFSLWIELSRNINALELQRLALEQKIGICPGNIFTVSGQSNHFIRLNYCPLWNLKIDGYLKKLGRII